MRRDALAALLAALCGWAWGQPGLAALAALAAVLPLLWGMASCRWTAGGIALAYFLTASRGLPFGAGVFFAESAPAWFSWAVWIAAGLVNAAVWMVCWRRDARQRALGAVAALVVTAVPPVGIVGWVNPLTAAGWWFPGMGFIGLALMAGVVAVLAARRWAVVGMLAGAAVVANVCAVAWPKPHAPELASWSARNTQFRRLQTGVLGQVNARLQLVMDLAQELQPGQAVVLPETVLPANSPALSWLPVMLDAAAEQLQAKGALVLVGAELAKPGKPMQNVLLPLGEPSAQPLVQRVPVPIGMWRPWERETYAADLLGSGVAQLRGLKVGYLVCYEQLLVWPVLLSMSHSPALLVGAANGWWARDTSIPAIQGQALDAWGRLFSVPVVRAINL